MKRIVGTILLSLAPIAIVATGCTPRTSQWVWEVGSSGQWRASSATRKALQRIVDIHFKDERLDKVFAALHKESGLSIHANWAALEAVGIERDAEVSLDLKGVTVADGLRFILDQIAAGETELWYETGDDVVRVSTADDLSRRTIVRIYDISDFVQKNWQTRVGQEPIHQSLFDETREPGRREFSVCSARCSGLRPHAGDILIGAEAVSQLLQAIDPESWREQGGNIGYVRVYGPLLVVQQTSKTHAEIEALLATLRLAVNHQ